MLRTRSFKFPGVKKPLSETSTTSYGINSTSSSLAVQSTRGLINRIGRRRDPDFTLFVRLSIITFMLGPSMTGQRSGHYKAGEKQVAMVAQKVVDAKHTHQQGRPFVTTPDPRTTAFWTLLQLHSTLSVTSSAVTWSMSSCGSRFCERI
jgi:hypothetical protein